MKTEVLLFVLPIFLFRHFMKAAIPCPNGKFSSLRQYHSMDDFSKHTIQNESHVNFDFMPCFCCTILTVSFLPSSGDLEILNQNFFFTNGSRQV